jgi:hypothetical protein
MAGVLCCLEKVWYSPRGKSPTGACLCHFIFRRQAMPLIKQISIKWHIDDVLSVRPNLTKAQASEVLQHLQRNHDANIGINWEVIEAVSDVLFSE